MSANLDAATWNRCIELLAQKTVLVRQQSRHSSVRGETDQLVPDPDLAPLLAVFQEPCQHKEASSLLYRADAHCSCGAYRVDSSHKWMKEGMVSRRLSWQDTVAADRGALWGAFCLAIPKTALGTEFSEQLLRCMDDRAALDIIKRWLEGA